MSEIRYQITGGRYYPMGATFDGEGVNFAVFSAHADKIELCLFSRDGLRETQRLRLPERRGDIWHGYVAGLRPGSLYGFRAYGPYAPYEGHRFNPHKLLLDPYTKRIHGSVRMSDAVRGYVASSDDLSFDTRDSAAFVPRSVVVDPSFNWEDDRRLETDLSRSVIYEAHVKGLTFERTDIGEGLRGTFLGLSSQPMLDHLTRLGVTAIELLPVQAFVDDGFLVDQGLSNYWGYQTIGFFSPEPRYMSDHDIAEFQMMVRRFHSAGIEVILDVVYNHTAEGNERGPTLCFRGLDNASYYRLQASNRRYYQNHTGTGNTLNLDHPMVLRMVLDSLRYWVTQMHVDGFRFDLASVLGRNPSGFDRDAPFFQAILQDPVLSAVKLIAEPWDVGPGGYQLGAYPAPFMEWNDQFRDDVRMFWRGDAGTTPKLADRLVGSAPYFDHSGRTPLASVNFLAAHDGFTLQDVVSYNEKHNEANGEENADGHNENHTDNMGVEGPTDDPEILAARNLRKRNLLSTLMLSQGTPMLLAGDEIGNSQSGNNNAYCQDNAVGWVNWENADENLLEFVRRLIAVRRSHPVLRQRLFLHSNQRPEDGMTDLFWRLPDGQEADEAHWLDPAWHCLCVVIRAASNTPDYDDTDDEVFIVFNGGGHIDVTMPARPEGRKWVQILDTARPALSDVETFHDNVEIAATSVCAFVLRPV